VGSFDGRSLHKYFDLLQNRRTRRRSRTHCIRPQLGVRHIVPRLRLALIRLACAGETVAAGTLPEPIEPTLKIRSNMSNEPFVITPKNCRRPPKVLGEHAAVLASGEAP